MAPGARLARCARGARAAACLAFGLVACDGEVMNLGRSQDLTGGDAGAGATAGSAGTATAGGAKTWQLQEQPIVEQTWTKEPVEIGNDCWIGMGACILPGARLGDGCVVGGGSVVVGELEPNCIAVGNPARVIKHR